MRDEAGARELHGQRQADVAEADDADARAAGPECAAEQPCRDAVSCSAGPLRERRAERSIAPPLACRGAGRAREHRRAPQRAVRRPALAARRRAAARRSAGGRASRRPRAAAAPSAAGTDRRGRDARSAELALAAAMPARASRGCAEAAACDSRSSIRRRGPARSRIRRCSASSALAPGRRSSAGRSVASPARPIAAMAFGAAEHAGGVELRDHLAISVASISLRLRRSRTPASRRR